MTETSYLEFTFNPHPASFRQLLNEILATIHSRMAEQIAGTAVLQKCRWILTELITNAHKHSGKDEACIKLASGSNYLIITREDTGHPLSLRLVSGEHLRWPLTAKECNSTFCIQEDELHSLRVITDNTGTAQFQVSQKAGENGERTNDMLEHFGLIIIASSCERFIYEHQTSTGKNIFTCVVTYE